MTKQTPRISTMSVDGFVVTFADALDETANRAAIAFEAALRDDPNENVVETAPLLTSVYVRFNPSAANDVYDWLNAALSGQNWFSAPYPSGGHAWRIPVCLDGPQFNEAIELADLTPTQAVADIESAQQRVLALGFAPGQPYLGMLPDHWNIPRQTGLTPQVPAGALCVAVGQMVLFGESAPTGWRMIGETAFRCYDETREDSIALRAGDVVRFRAVDRDELEMLRNLPFGGADRSAL